MVCVITSLIVSAVTALVVGAVIHRGTNDRDD
jgi:hypothetical protein